MKYRQHFVSVLIENRDEFRISSEHGVITEIQIFGLKYRVSLNSVYIKFVTW